MENEWTKEAPWELIKNGHTTFLIRGHQDKPEDAIAVKLISADKKTNEQMVWESVMVGLTWSRGIDVVGNGNAFGRRPLYEVENAMWKQA